MNLNTLSKTLVILCTALASATTMGRAQAGTAVAAAPQVVVHYSDLNLHSEAGIQRLYQRIEQAVVTVCHPAANERDLAVQVRTRACTRQSTAQAVGNVHSPELSAYYLAHLRNAPMPAVLASAR